MKDEELNLLILETYMDSVEIFPFVSKQAQSSEISHQDAIPSFLFKTYLYSPRVNHRNTRNRVYTQVQNDPTLLLYAGCKLHLSVFIASLFKRLSFFPRMHMYLNEA